MAGTGSADLFLLPVSPIANLPDVVSRHSVSSRQFSSWGRRGSNLRDLILGEFGSTSTMQILDMRYGFQMVWANARTIVAKVVYLQSFWDWAKGVFIGNAMCCIMLPESAISVSVYVPVPDKTHRGESTIPLIPQLFTPDRTWPQTCRVTATKTSWATFKKVRELSTPTLAELPTRLKAHVGLLLRLTLGGGVSVLPRSLHLIGSIR